MDYIFRHGERVTVNDTAFTALSLRPVWSGRVIEERAPRNSYTAPDVRIKLDDWPRPLNICKLYVNPVMEG